jgi:molecular chaperone GrpE
MCFKVFYSLVFPFIMNIMTRKKNKEIEVDGAKPDQEPAAEGDETEAAIPEPDLSNPLVELERERDALRDQNMRLYADFDNFRKRTARERVEIIRHANEDLITEILPVLDHFELALKQPKDSEDPFYAGVRMVFEQLANTLEKNAQLTGIQAVGTPFDPELHEAISTQPSDEIEEGIVIMQTRCGYKMGERVIRPALVIVSSGAADEAGDPHEAKD